MPLDRHIRCVLCLGYQHALLSRETPQSCMNCFQLPARTKEAPCHFFASKLSAQAQLNSPPVTQGRISWPARSVPRVPASAGSHFSSVPPPPPSQEVGVEVEDDYEGGDNVHVETIISGDSEIVSELHTASGRDLASRFEGIINRSAGPGSIYP